MRRATVLRDLAFADAHTLVMAASWGSHADDIVLFVPTSIGPWTRVP